MTGGFGGEEGRSKGAGGGMVVVFFRCFISLVFSSFFLFDRGIDGWWWFQFSIISRREEGAVASWLGTNSAMWISRHR